MISITGGQFDFSVRLILREGVKQLEIIGIDQHTDTRYIGIVTEYNLHNHPLLGDLGTLHEIITRYFRENAVPKNTHVSLNHNSDGNTIRLCISANWFHVIDNITIDLKSLEGYMDYSKLVYVLDLTNKKIDLLEKKIESMELTKINNPMRKRKRFGINHWFQVDKITPPIVGFSPGLLLEAEQYQFYVDSIRSAIAAWIDFEPFKLCTRLTRIHLNEIYRTDCIKYKITNLNSICDLPLIDLRLYSVNLDSHELIDLIKNSKWSNKLEILFIPGTLIDELEPIVKLLPSLRKFCYTDTLVQNDKCMVEYPQIECITLTKRGNMYTYKYVI